LLGVDLGDRGGLLARAAACEVEREPHDPLAALLGEQRRLQGDLVARAAAGQVAPAEARVLALAVLPDDHPVQLGLVGPAQRGDDAGVEAHRAHVGPLVEALADGQAQAPQADVVGDRGPADRTEVDGVEAAQHLEAVRVHHAAGLLVVAAAPGKPGPLEREAAAGRGGEGVEDGPARGHDLDADPVGRDGGDAERALLGRCGHGASESRPRGRVQDALPIRRIGPAYPSRSTGVYSRAVARKARAAGVSGAARLSRAMCRWAGGSSRTARAPARRASGAHAAGSTASPTPCITSGRIDVRWATSAAISTSVPAATMSSTTWRIRLPAGEAIRRVPERAARGTGSPSGKLGPGRPTRTNGWSSSGRTSSPGGRSGPGAPTSPSSPTPWRTCSTTSSGVK